MDHLETNRVMWDERAAAHAASPDYAVQRFRDDPSFVSGVVAFDRERLGDLTGVRGAHLQCHIGTDTLSLERLGARMTGLDFSPASIEQARSLAHELGAATDFVVGDVHDAVGLLGAGGFDLVYTGVGALCWLPSTARWAEVVAGLLRPGGRLFLRDGHPVLWALDPERDDDALVLTQTYFEPAEPAVWDEPGTYVDTDVEFQHTVWAEWNHGLGEIVQSLLDAGLHLTSLVEHRSVPWRALPHMVGGEDGEFRLPEHDERVPLTFTLTATRPE